MSAPWAWHLTIEADFRRACSCRRALTLNQAHRVRTSPGICIRDPSGSQNTPLKGRGPQNMSRHGNFLIQMASPCGMLMQSRSEPKVTLDFCIDFTRSCPAAAHGSICPAARLGRGREIKRSLLDLSSQPPDCRLTCIALLEDQPRKVGLSASRLLTSQYHLTRWHTGPWGEQPKLPERRVL